MKNLMLMYLLLFVSTTWGEEQKSQDFEIECKNQEKGIEFTFKRLHVWSYGHHRSDEGHLLIFDSVSVFGIYNGKNLHFSNSKGQTWINFSYGEPNYEGGRAPHGEVQHDIQFHYGEKIPDELSLNKFVAQIKVDNDEVVDSICTFKWIGE